jgi:hypothetical protein
LAKVSSAAASPKARNSQPIRLRLRAAITAPTVA